MEWRNALMETQMCVLKLLKHALKSNLSKLQALVTFTTDWDLSTQILEKNHQKPNIPSYCVPEFMQPKDF